MFQNLVELFVAAYNRSKKAPEVRFVNENDVSVTSVASEVPAGAAAVDQGLAIAHADPCAHSLWAGHASSVRTHRHIYSGCLQAQREASADDGHGGGAPKVSTRGRATGYAS